MKLKLEAILVFRKFELFMCLIALKKINERLFNTIKYDQLKLRVKGFILFCFIYISFIFFFIFIYFLFSFVSFYLFIIIFFFIYLLRWFLQLLFGWSKCHSQNKPPQQ